MFPPIQPSHPPRHLGKRRRRGRRKQRGGREEGGERREERKKRKKKTEKKLADANSRARNTHQDPSLKRTFGEDGKVREHDWSYLGGLRTLRKPHEPMARLVDLLEYLNEPGLEHVWVMFDVKVCSLFVVRI